MELCSIASGSSGNCICVGSDDSHLLIDAGISGRRIEEGLHQLDLKCEELKGVLVTHEHIDHIAGLGVLARRYGLPIYATAGTKEAILRVKSLGKVDESLFRVVEPEVDFVIGDLTVEPIAISHDAAEPVAYRIRHGEKSAAVITDLGTYDDELVAKLQDLDVLLLEANHDVNMLQVGPYPYPLKQRILGDRGHLSNERSGHLLGQLLHDGFKAAVLGHQSKENNNEKKAYETVRLEILNGDNPYRGDDFPVYVAKRDTPSERICF